MKQIFFIFVIAQLTLVSCSSPESDGIKAAEAVKECNDKFTQDLIDLTQEFIDKFESYKFQTRIEAREKNEALIGEANDRFSKRSIKADEKYRDLKSKYIGNAEKLKEFEFAYNSKVEFDGEQIRHGIPNQLHANELIRTIIPPLPDSEQIQIDLIGRKISEQPNGYHRKDWFWKIEAGEIRDFEILNKKESNNECLYELKFIVQDTKQQGLSHEVFINLTYVLRDSDSWTIGFLESKQVNIVKTGKYDTCITSLRKGYSGEFYIEFTNHSDVDLAVGGEVKYEFYDERRHFSTVVKANSTGKVGGLFVGSVDDYEIHFIERP